MLNSIKKPSGSCRLNARIFCWFLISLNLLLAVFVTIATAIILNLAPFHQLLDVWVSVVIVFYVLLAVLIALSFVYKPKGTVEENATPTVTDLAGSSEETKTNAAASGKPARPLKEIVIILFSVLLTSVCVFVGTSFMYPEAYHSTAGLRIQKLGAVTDSTAKIFLRDADSNTTHTLLYREASSNGAFSSVVFDVEKDRDNTKYVTLTGLNPSTTYTYFFDEDGKKYNFTTAPVVGTSGTFSLYFGSCFMYNVPNFQAAPGWGFLDEVFNNGERDPSKSLIAFIGDFIYSDHPWYKGDSEGAYSSMYRQTYTNPHIQETLSKYPSYYIFDDHEVYDNWDEGKTGIYINAMKVWNNYLGFGNPTVNDDNEYFSVDYADVSMFFLDTRSYRSSNKMKDGPTKTMIGAEQKQKLFDWLLAKKTTAVFKFLISPVGWTSMLTDNDDGWGKGFHTERQEIFNFIRANSISGCVFLSGDSHIAYGKLELDFPGSGFFEFSASPLSAFSSALGGFGGSETWDEDGNETLEWYSLGGGAFISMFGIVDVDTTAAEPYFNVSFYEGTTLQHRTTVNLTSTIPGAVPP